MPAATARNTKAATAKTPAAKPRVVKAPVAKAPAGKARVTKAPAVKAPPVKARAVKAPTAKVPQPRAGVAAKSSRTTKVRAAAAKTAELSQDVFTSVETGQRTAIAAVRTFVDTVDAALPLSTHPSHRETVIDAALDMADKLVTTQYHFLRNVVRGADRSLKLSDAKKE